MLKKIGYFILFISPSIYSIFRLKYNIVFYGIIFGVYILFTLDYLWFKKIKTSIFMQLGITFIFLDLTFQNIQWSEFLGFLKDIHYIYIIPIFFNVWLNLLLRSYKWKFFFQKEKISLYNLISATSIGFMINAIFPARIGEIARGVILADKENFSYSASITTIFTERILDGFVLLIFLIILLLGFPLEKSSVTPYILTGGVIFTFALVFIIFFYFFKSQTEVIISFVLKRISPKTNKAFLFFLNKIYIGLHIFKNYKKLLIFIILTILNWFINLFTIVLIMKSVNALQLFHVVHIDYFYSSLLILLLICMAIAIPSGPGGAGPYQASVLFAFTILNPVLNQSVLLKSKAAGFSIYIWLVQAFAVVFAGLFFYLRGHYSLRKWNELHTKNYVIK